MLRPIDSIRCFHNAFRKDLFQIDSSVLGAAKSGASLTPDFERLQVFSEILDVHAQGEEAAVFPAVNKITANYAQTYIIDHRELDKMTDALEAIGNAPDPLTAARATAVLQSHLRIHLDKEDALLYPLLRERTTDAEQISIVQVMSSKVPPQHFPIVIQWLFSLLNLQDQITLTTLWMIIMPPEVFAQIKTLIKKNTGQNWLELTRQIPSLTEG